MRGQQISIEQIERIKQLSFDTSNTAAIARAVGVSRATVIKYVSAKDEFDEVRHEKRVTLVAAIADELSAVRQLYLDHLKQPDVIAAASAKDSAVIVGVMTDKFQLVTGEATERREHVDATDAREQLVRRADEIEARRAARSDHGRERGAG